MFICSYLKNRTSVGWFICYIQSWHLRHCVLRVELNPVSVIVKAWKLEWWHLARPFDCPPHDGCERAVLLFQLTLILIYNCLACDSPPEACDFWHCVYFYNYLKVDCVWFKEIQTSQSISFPVHNWCSYIRISSAAKALWRSGYWRQ